ncbi:MAG TPA: serine/threonine-protein kinase [Vineibacter sp.]|nr:serine/threonine-protein kinase [Vineibacter sp.]
MVGEDRPAAQPDDDSPVPPAADGEDEALPAGSMVGKYDIVEVLGQGGFGITYRARDSRLDRDVAIKEYLPTSFARRHGTTTVLPRSTRTAEDFLWGRERFLDEAKTLARLENTAGIINVYDYLEANGTAYMVMALARGETLEARLKRSGRLPQTAIEQFFYPLLDGLEKVHAAGFLHRDIKPANILLDADGRPTLIDFGASRQALQGRTKAMTAVFTPGYAAFEQATSAQQGPWTDIYALAATLYQSIAGAPPPSAMERMSEDTLVPAAEVGKARYAPSLLVAIDAGLKLKAADRPQSVADWRRVMDGQSITVPTNAMTRRMEEPLTAAAPVPRRGRGRTWMAAAVLALLVAAGGGWFALDSQRRAESEAARKVAEEKAVAEAARKAAADKAAAEDKAKADAEIRRRAEAAETALRLTERDRYQVRLALTSLGFDAGPGDAAFGTRSRPMIAAWQKSRGFPDTGFLTGPQLTALREQAAEALARDDERLKRQEEARRKAEQETAARKAAEEAAAAEAARKAAAEKAAADAARKAAEEKAAAETAARRKADQEAAARKAAEEKAAAEAAARKAAEEKAAAEATRKAAEEKAAAEAAARRKAEQEAAARKAAEEKAAAEAAARKAAEEKAAAEIAARRKAQEAAWRAAAEESGRRAEEQARAETARRQAAEEKASAEAAAKRKADQEAAARRAAEEKAAAEAKRKAEEEARKSADDKAKAGAQRQQAEAAETALGLTDRDRRQVRVALKSLGFDAGAGEGPFGDRSRPMIAAWQKSRGFNDTGYLTGPQVASLRQQAAAAIARDEEEQKKQLEARRKAEEEAKRQAAAPAGGDLVAAWPAFQGCLTSSGGTIAGGGTRYNITQRKVCFTGAGGRYEVALENGMVCAAAARKTGGVGFTVERQTCTAPTSGNPQFTTINNFDAPCSAGQGAGTLSCRTNYSNGSSGGPYLFRRQ